MYRDIADAVRQIKSDVARACCHGGRFIRKLLDVLRRAWCISDLTR